MTALTVDSLNSHPDRVAAFLTRKEAHRALVVELPIPAITRTQNTQTASTLSKANNAPSSSPQRPELAPPNYMREVLSLQPAVDDTLRRQMDLFRVESAQETKSLEALLEE